VITIRTDGIDSNSLMTVVAIDVDTPVPDRQTLSATPTYMRVNIPMSSPTDDSLAIDDSCGDSVLSNIPPHPLRGTGFHRIVWMALEQPERLDIRKLRADMQSTQYDMKKWLLQSTQYIPRGLAFHRCAWTPAVSDMYKNGQISELSSIYQSMQHSPQHDDSQPVVTDVNAEDRVKVLQEPVFGRTIERSWEQVVRRLYRYAFK
jgi:hypothetical protein